MLLLRVRYIDPSAILCLLFVSFVITVVYFYSYAPQSSLLLYIRPRFPLARPSHLPQRDQKAVTTPTRRIWTPVPA